jgi:hypothetical protein
MHYITFTLKTHKTFTFEMDKEGVLECMDWFLSGQHRDIRVAKDEILIFAGSVAHIAIA